jgi:uncharacterized protein
MPVWVNIVQLERQPIQLTGEVPAEELGLEALDDLMRAAGPLRYDIDAELQPRGLLVRGGLEMVMACECARCLRPFDRVIRLPEWSCLLPLEGEDRVPVLQDCVDLTPQMREDIVLSLPQRPLCEPQCRGLSGNEKGPNSDVRSSDAASACDLVSPWSELDRLKID